MSNEERYIKGQEPDFNLSEKIVDLEGQGEIFCNYIHGIDVKEFIKRLKEEHRDIRHGLNAGVCNKFNEIIDKLAGEDLTRGGEDDKKS